MSAGLTERLVVDSFWDFFWFIISFFILMAYLMVLFQIVGDLFRDKEVSGASRRSGSSA